MKNNVYLLKTTDRDISIEMQYGFRKRLTLTVYPDRRVIARIPYGLPKRRVEEYLLKKSNWMIRHLDHFEQHPPEKEKHYSNGEIHSYLGRDYVLKLEQGPTSVCLTQDTLRLRVRDIDDPGMKMRALDNWYRKEAIRVMTPRYEEWSRKLQYLGLPETSLRFYRMKRRWGSCSSKHIITLNTELIKKDLQLIDYVIVHEICHLKVPAHNKDFYALLGSVMPDWKQYRHALNDLP